MSDLGKLRLRRHSAISMTGTLLKWRRRFVTQLGARKGEKFTFAYANNLANRLPLIYCVVIFDIAILAAGFQGSAPSFLTQAVPLLLAVAIASRAFYWLPRKIKTRPRVVLARDINRLSVLGSAIAFASTIWALSLYPYGDANQQSLVHYIVGITCFTGILALGQAPLAAVRISMVTIWPSTAWFLLYQHPNAVAVCTVQLIVSGILLIITYKYHEDFIVLERSRQHIVQRELESSLLASRDALTGAPNRRAILSRLETLLDDSSRLSPWLAMVDLDGFKHVNDTFGHAAGDAVLQGVCRRIEEVEEIIAFGRLGGDEFAIILPGDLSSLKAHSVLEGLIESISRPIIYDDARLSVSASIGLRLTEGKSVNDCLKRADEALYKAKDRPGRVVQFAAADENEMRERRAITRLFCSADLKEQISVVYQPIIDFDSRKTLGFEALARWSPDAASCIMPSTFVSLAESTGRTRELTASVLDRALREFLSVHGGPNLSVNLSAQDLLKDAAEDWISGIVEKAGASPTLVTLEITETAVMTDIRRAAATLEALRLKGFRIALDDFGTGQSSLSRVHKLPLDQIKIDQSFAKSLDRDATARAVAATIVSLARQLRLECTIEGIETIEQANSARLLGLRSMQGYLFGRPSAIGDVRDFRVA